MSGFEVVGVVLGAIPLLISAIQAYSHHMQGWKAAASELKSLHRQLTTEEAKLYNVCELLISDMVPSQDIEPMLADPFGPMWKSKHTDDLVRRRLWQSYRPFVDAFQEVNEALGKITERLEVQISGDGQVKWLERGQMTRQFKKFLFRLKRDEFLDELTVISKSIGDMETLVRQGVSLEPSRKKRSRGKVYQILRDLATSIHRALCSNICCSDHHDVGLELATRFIEMNYEGGDEDVRRGAEFKMAISFEIPLQTGSSNSATKRYWDELSIQAAALETPDASQPEPTQAKTTKSFKKVTFRKSQTLSFMGVGSYSRPPMPNATTAIALAARPVTNVAFIETTTRSPDQTGPFNLCMALKKACGTDKRPICYGHLVDHGCSSKRQFRVCPLGTSSFGSDSWSIVTLEDVLQHKKDLKPLVLLAEKVQLALAIASSVLQLSKTPWLSEGLTNKNVHFFRRGNARLFYNHAFLLTSLPRQESSKYDNNMFSMSLSRSSLSINPTMFSLGILLLEIFLGESFEKLQSYSKEATEFDDDDDDDDDILCDLGTAHKLLEKRVKRENREYADVVQWCISCTRRSGLDNDGFRQDVYNNVLMQLECLVDYNRII